MSTMLLTAQQAFEQHTGYQVDHLVLREASTGTIEVGFAYLDGDELIVCAIELPIEVLEKRSLENLFGDVLPTIVNQENGDDAG